MSSNKYYKSTLQLGSEGDEVKEWQKFLRSLGNVIEIDGIYGDSTKLATEAYQKRAGLTVSGNVDDETWGKAGYKNVYTPLDAPSSPVYDTTNYKDTEAGGKAWQDYLLKLGAVSGLGDFKFSKDKELSDAYKSIQDYGDFKYNVNEDELYRQLAERYREQGKLAMEDTMGQAAAMTGGYGNSYAQTVGQQVYNDYMKAADDKAADYYQLALDRYKMGRDSLVDEYSLLMSEYERELGEHSTKYDKAVKELALAKDNYATGADEFYANQSNKNAVAQQENLDAWTKYEYDEGVRQYLAAGQGDTGSNVYTFIGESGDGKNVYKIGDKTVKVPKGENPYTETKHPDVDNGVMENGYQPDNVNGQKLTKTDYLDFINGAYQPIYKTDDGTEYIWDEQANAYKKYTK